MLYSKSPHPLHNRLGVVLILFGHQILLFFLLRFALLLTYWSSLPHNPLVLFQTFGIGLWLDIVVASWLTLPFLLYAALIPDSVFKQRWHIWLIKSGHFLVLYALTFLNAADYFFFDEFNSRFNYVAVDYLFSTPLEVFGNIWQSYPVPLVSAGVAVWVGLLLFPTRHLLRQWLPSRTKSRIRFALVLTWLILCGAISTTVNIRLLDFSPNRILNEIGANGFYTLFYALKTNDLNYDQFYIALDEAEALKRVTRHVVQPGERLTHNKNNPLERLVPQQPGLGKVNVVVILEESLGSEFVESLRHKNWNVTPHLEALAEKGLFFTRFHATGTRTVRALEAVLASFPPIPGTSIVKRHKSQNIHTLAKLFKAQGYNTQFIYGGRGLFDSMRRFMLDNGYDRFIEQKDFKNPTFSTIWGVCDEDIFHKAIEEFDALHVQGKPFFSTILTVSNHKPYTYPKGRIDKNPDEHARLNAVKYADWAIGDFFEKARSRPFFKDTVFVLMGDHGARVYGASFIPIDTYGVPLLIYSPHLIQPRRIHTLGCSMDVGPTLLGLLGLEYKTVFYGRDLLRLKPSQGYVLLQHDREIGLLKGSKLAVLSTGKFSAVFDYDQANSRFTKILKLNSQEENMILDAASFYQTAYHLYMADAHRLSQEK
ncbi:MAG: sulfatase-like hydrolase/transferase [Elusimicrobia bacterium]|nr:sulfatase-like hydrolase/transferase [Elusimicrobiota bacterium]